MATESTHVSAVIPARPQVVYAAWLSSEQHARMTGGAATIDPSIGGAHRAWDEYISGTTLELDPGRRIVQSWRTSQFPAEHGDSRIVVLFEEEGDHTRLTIEHTEIPEGQAEDYKAGWTKFYFDPMIAHFAVAAKAAKKTAAKKASAKPAAKKAAAAGKPVAKATKKTAKATKKTAAKKAAKATKKTAAKKTAKATKKTAAKKAGAKKTAKAAKKPAAKTAAKKTTGKPARRAAGKAASGAPTAGA